MLTKIQRFLQSVGIEDTDRFDLSFVLAARNPYKKNQVDMVIEKTVPWEYALLDEFIQASSRIQYEYTLRFTYLNDPTEEDVASLFFEWYFARYGAIPPASLDKKEQGVLLISYPNQEARDRSERSIKDFRDLLKYVNYPFVIEETVKEPEPEPVAEETQPEPEPVVTEAQFAPETAEETQPAFETVNEEPKTAPNPVSEPEPSIEETMAELEVVEEEPEPASAEEAVFSPKEESLEETAPVLEAVEEEIASAEEPTQEETEEIIIEEYGTPTPDGDAMVEKWMEHSAKLTEDEALMEEILNLDSAGPSEEELEAIIGEPSQQIEIQADSAEISVEEVETAEISEPAEPVSYATETASFDASSSQEEDDEDDNDDDDDDDEDEEPEDEATRLINQDAVYYRTAGEEELFHQFEARREWKKEQENRERVWTKGNYAIVQRIDEIFHMAPCNVDFEGEVFQVKFSLGKNGRASNSFSMGDSSNAINLRAFEGRVKKEELEKLAPGQKYRVRGAIDIDKFTQSKVVIVHFMNRLPDKTFRTDEEPKKRVELHLHTNMSTMDGIAPFKDFYEAARAMGMTAIGLCDHGAVQSFPAAQYARDAHVDSLKGSTTDEKPLKILYGTELYMFDPSLHPTMNPADIPLKGARYCVFDTETTGLSCRHDKIIEFGGVVVQDGHIVDSYGTLINPQTDLKDAEGALRVNHIDPADLLRAPTFEEVLPRIRRMFENCILVAHNAPFDVGILNSHLIDRGLEPISNPVIDTVALSRFLFPTAARHREGDMLRRLGLGESYDDEDAHRAVYDATALNEGWQEIVFRLNALKPGIRHCDLDSLQIPDPADLPKGNPDDPNDIVHLEWEKKEEEYRQYFRHIHEHHVTAFAKDKQGIHDLFFLTTQSLTTYMARIPKMPRALLNSHREHLLLGTACFNGEVFDTAMTRNREDLVKVISFYDFVEIQPLENYSYLINMGRIASKERLIMLLRDIVEAARIAGKPVVATGDAHYVDPSDKIYRDVFISAKGIGAGSHPLFPPAREKMPYFENPDQHFRTTKEMLDSFRQWCSEEEAQEFVVTNSNLIADMMEDNIVIVDKKTYTPDANLPNSDKILRELCETNFHKNYDYTFDDDPKVKEAVQFCWERLQKELTGIITSGYSVTYYIAHRLIKLANAEPEHFIVGSRGSVGSSFAATMAEITEVNALPAHYHCPHCHYLEFMDTQKYRSGFDLPDRTCPKCGHKLEGNGQNIPFETFLGFHADKVPDIDLNFEDESQHRAHDYCRDLLGANNVYRAGTIETVAEKTAFGYVRGYFEKIGRNLDQISSNYIAYIASHCQGVKRTTGQHPGGIVVIPADRSVYDFTAVQHPADDINSDWLTTHFDFHALHDEILKLDILGHVDPMAMRYYRDLTGVKIEDIPTNDPKVLSLFSSEKALNMHRNFLGYDTGAAALPEFGTTQGMQMLSTLRPKTFNDLIIISGLAHGTNVWAGNAEDLIKEGKSINEIIGCRDEIMTYLISMGLDSSLAFTIMEGVRKGKKLKPNQEAEMRAHGVPDFYIDSCNKIAYLFPRGHAVAYVTMAVRVAYFKLYYPLEFYAVFFSIRSDDWDIKTMIEGEDSVINRIKEWGPRMKDRDNPLSTKEVKQYKTLLVALEMLERGYKFSNIDLYRSDYKMFVVDHENKALIPPFSVIEGLGQSVAKSICDAREETNEYGEKKRFISKQDLLERASRLSNSLLKKLDDLGVLKGLSETNQVSLFEFL
ncbi:MAG: PolC-type DNA polymerase III [Bacilli bacterium]|nr:PolC-type DNA polymerase III [Bacilli bacterium]